MTTDGSTKRLSNFSRGADCLTQRREGAKKSAIELFFAALRLCVMLSFSGQAIGAWPFARGGLDSTGATATALPDEPAVLWTYDSGGSAFEATPVVSDGVIYLGDADGTAHAVRLSDGSEVWKQNLGETFLLSPAAVMRETALFVPDADGVVHCLSLDDGAERWAFETGSEVFGGPLVVGADDTGWLLLVPTEGGKLFAVDAATGAERWVFQIDAPLRCTPTVVSGHALLAGCDGKLHTVDVQTGQESGAVDIGGPTGNTAAARDGVAYFGTEQGEFYAVDVSDPNAPTVQWTYRDPKRGQGIRTAAALLGETLVYANQSKAVYGLASPTGEPTWQTRTRSRIEASPLALAGDRVLIATTRGRLLLLDGGSGETVWTFEAGGEFLASPAASDARVLVANTDGLLYCLGQEERTGDAR